MPPNFRVNVTIGKYYAICVFNKIIIGKCIRSTKKGINFVVDDERLYRFNSHFYDRSFAHKKIPANQKHFNITVVSKYISDIKPIENSKITAG